MFTCQRRYRESFERNARHTWENADMTAAIFVILALVAVGLLVDGLFRLRSWLQRPVPPRDAQEPPDDASD
jgi:hypothetical protein